MLRREASVEPPADALLKFEIVGHTTIKFFDFATDRTFRFSAKCGDTVAELASVAARTLNYTVHQIKEITIDTGNRVSVFTKVHINEGVWTFCGPTIEWSLHLKQDGTCKGWLQLAAADGTNAGAGAGAADHHVAVAYVIDKTNNVTEFGSFVAAN